MAEIAALANFAAVVGAGLKLSIALYDFASTIGSAGREIKALGADISLFCAVLKQVQSVLGKAKGYRVSGNAIQTAQDVLDRCTEVFDDVRSILEKLQGEDKSSVDMFARIKWTFKRAKVIMLQESLRSCTGMLQLMLATMSFAERIATIGQPTAESEAEDEEQRNLTHSLFLAQQSANERLEELEDHYFKEETTSANTEATQAALRLSTDTSLFPMNPRGAHRRNRSSRAILHLTDSDTAELLTRAGRRTSALLNGLLYQEEDFRDRQRQTWTQVTNRRQSIIQSNNLLQSWTNQFDPLAEEYPSDSKEEMDRMLPEDPVHTVMVPLSDDQTTMGHQFSSEDMGQSGMFFRSPKYSLEDPCWKVLPAALKQYNITDDWREYSIWLVDGSEERCVGLEEKPLFLRKNLDRTGRKPMFMLRKRRTPGISSRTLSPLFETNSDSPWGASAVTASSKLPDPAQIPATLTSRSIAQLLPSTVEHVQPPVDLPPLDPLSIRVIYSGGWTKLVETPLCRTADSAMALVLKQLSLHESDFGKFCFWSMGSTAALTDCWRVSDVDLLQIWKDFGRSERKALILAKRAEHFPGLEERHRASQLHQSADRNHESIDDESAATGQHPVVNTGENTGGHTAAACF